jgi:hypothetical protein
MLSKEIERKGVTSIEIKNVWNRVEDTKKIGDMSRESARDVIERVTERTMDVVFQRHDVDGGKYDQVVRDSVRDSVSECVLQSMDRRFSNSKKYDFVGWYCAMKVKIDHFPETLQRHQTKHEARIKAREAMKKKMIHVDKMVSGLGNGTVSMSANRSPLMTLIYFSICTSPFLSLSLSHRHKNKRTITTITGLFVVCDLIVHAYHGTYDQLWYFSMMKSVWKKLYGGSSPSDMNGSGLEELKHWLDERSREL